MRKELLTVRSNECIADNIYKLILAGDMIQDFKKPGQFVHLKVSESMTPLLRRPISVAEINHDQSEVTLIFRKEGEGTGLLAEKKRGDQVDVLGPLGNGFDVESFTEGKKALIIGGGVGVPPLYELSKQLTSKGILTTHVLGFQSAKDVFFESEFKGLGETFVATADGTYGFQGFVTDVIDTEQLDFDYLLACGPTPMLRALKMKYPDREVYLSMEERMGCGIGACFACVCHTDQSEKTYVKVCLDGPVFKAEEVLL